MTLAEASRAGIEFLTRPEWDSHARIQLTLDPRGWHGPWATVLDAGTDSGAIDPPPRVPVFNIPEDGGEPWHDNRG